MEQMLLDMLLPLIIWIVQYSPVEGEDKRKIVHVPGDLLLGGLFPMHEQVLIVLKRLRFYLMRKRRGKIR